MRADPENIATFVAVVRGSSLSAAARSLGLPKSTVSRRVQRLEEQLGSDLLSRDGRTITPTSVGRRFYDSVQRAVDDLAAAANELSRTSSAPGGVIRVTAPPDLGRMVLSPMFVAFLKRQPEIQLDVTLTTRFVDLVQEGVDLAVRAGRVTQPSLIARRLCSAELQLAIARDAPFDERRDLAQLAGCPFVLHRASGWTQQIKLEQGGAKRRQVIELSVSGRVNVDDYAAASELVAAGHGIGLLPSVHVQEGVQSGRLRRLYDTWSSRSANLYLVSAGRKQPARVRALADFLLVSFAKLPSV